MTINIKKNSNKEWEIAEIITVIRKVEVKADSYDKAKEINDNVLGSCEDRYCYCDDCEEETKPMLKENDYE